MPTRQRDTAPPSFSAGGRLGAAGAAAANAAALLLLLLLRALLRCAARPPARLKTHPPYTKLLCSTRQTTPPRPTRRECAPSCLATTQSRRPPRQPRSELHTGACCSRWRALPLRSAARSTALLRCAAPRLRSAAPARQAQHSQRAPSRRRDLPREHAARRSRRTARQRSSAAPGDRAVARFALLMAVMGDSLTRYLWW